jgi:hypothetical protein
LRQETAGLHVPLNRLDRAPASTELDLINGEALLMVILRGTPMAQHVRTKDVWKLKSSGRLAQPSPKLRICEIEEKSNFPSLACSSDEQLDDGVKGDAIGGTDDDGVILLARLGSEVCGIFGLNDQQRGSNDNGASNISTTGGTARNDNVIDTDRKKLTRAKVAMLL